MKTRVCAIALCAALVGAIATPANASVWTGACVISVTFNFTSPVEAVGTSPDYTLSGSGGLCGVSLDVFNPTRTTLIDGGGSSRSWTCGSTVGEGTWDESWNPNPPAVFGNHLITGTWGDWTIVVSNSSLSFAGVAEMTVDPSDAGKLVQCARTGISSLKMIGVLTFQDPAV
jgi:hypothetical protein